MGEGASTNKCSWEKDFTSFHYVKCTELGEHTLNKFYHNLLALSLELLKSYLWDSFLNITKRNLEILANWAVDIIKRRNLEE